MADSTQKKKRGRPKKRPVDMSDDELMERVFNKTVRKKLKKHAQEQRPKSEKPE